MATKKSAGKKAAKKAGAKKAAAKKGAAKKGAAKKGAAKKGAASQGRCANWRAWQDRMPPGPATLHVTGRCVFPTPGYRVTLRRAVPQGINPAIVLLLKVVTPPSGPRPDVVTTVEVRYRERNNRNITHVTILPEGKTIKVQQVS